MAQKPEKKPSELEKLRKELDARTRQWNAEQKAAKELENLPPAVILRARELKAQGKFKRKIIKRVPRDMSWDTLELECGHKTRSSPGLIDTDSNPGTWQCYDCIDAWLRRQARKKKRAS